MRLTLDDVRRQVVLRTVLEVARHRKWKVWAAHVLCTHVRVVVSAAAAVVPFLTIPAHDPLDR